MAVVQTNPEEILKKYLWDQSKFGVEEATAISRAFHNSIRARVRQKFEASGLEWKDFVFGDRNCLLTEKDFADVEAQLLATGYRFDVSATISAKEAPEKHKPLKGQHELEINTEVKDGRIQVGVGDNTVTLPQSIKGEALYVHTTDEVMALVMEGVPPGRIAIIDDSGGTLTAPILEQFAAVICMGGSVRSHLSILCREYGIPCFMNAKIGGINNGDPLEMNCAAPAKSALDCQKGIERTAEIWKLV
jgi:phosphohistidine swiveling domain-containing protein